MALRKKTAVVTMAAMIAPAGRADAGQVIDRQSTGVGASVGDFNDSDPRQTFKPGLTGIDFATFFLGTSHAAQATVVRLDIDAGSGITGS